MGIEKSHFRLGFVALADAAPLIVAKERGFFAEQGLNVVLERQASWSALRDKTAVGLLDAAQMLATLPLANTLGLGNERTPMIAAMGLNIGGNAITVSAPLAERMQAADPAAMAEAPLSARALKPVIAEARAAGKPPLVFATVYPESTHSYELRYWLAAAGIDADRDVRLVVVPPARMVAHLSAGTIDGYCVGEPWNSLAASLRLGRVLITSGELWSGRVEKVLGFTEAWADRHPETVKAMVKAVLLASAWTDRAENRAEVAAMLSRPSYLPAPPAVIKACLADPDKLVFHRHAATFPWRSQALWYLGQMRRWGQIDERVELRRVAERVFRSDLYRLAALELGLAVPLTDSKVEGRHDAPWLLTEATQPIPMAADRFCDGAVFDPCDIPATATEGSAARPSTNHRA